jgi:hypothetical protein
MANPSVTGRLRLSEDYPGVVQESVGGESLNPLNLLRGVWNLPRAFASRLKVSSGGNPSAHKTPASSREDRPIDAL